MILATGESFQGWPNVAGDRWQADSIDFRLPTTAASATNPSRLFWPRSTLAAIDRATGGLLLEWPNGPFQAAERLREQPPPAGAGYALEILGNRARLRTLGDGRIVRVEFRLTASAGLFRLGETLDSSPSADRAILELGWSPNAANSITLFPEADAATRSAAVGVSALFRRPESPPVRPIVGTRVVLEQGPFGRRLWAENRLIAEQTTAANRPLVCEWTKTETTVTDPPPLPAVENLRCWISLPPDVSSAPVRQPDLDSLLDAGGTVTYGRTTAITSDALTWEPGHTAPISCVRSVQFARSKAEPGVIHGWIGDLRLKSGGPPWRVALQDLTSTGIEVVHPLLGRLQIPAERMERFTVAASGESLLLEAGRIHLGDEFRPDFDEPAPRGLSWTATVAARQLEDLRKITQVSKRSNHPDSPPPPSENTSVARQPSRRLLFRALVRELGGPSGQRSNLVLRLNGTVIGPLSNRATSALVDELVEIPISEERWRPGDNLIDVGPDPAVPSATTTSPGAADDIELINPTIEWHIPRDGV